MKRRTRIEFVFLYFIKINIIKRGCVEYKEFDGTELFVTPRIGYWKLVD